MMPVAAKRVYDPAVKSDGVRIVVDRLWPRGVSREKLRADAWMPDIAPSAQLRAWFNHDPAKWEEFEARHFQELHARPEAVLALRALIEGRPATLLFAAKDIRHNQAVALLDYLRLFPQLKGRPEA